MTVPPENSTEALRRSASAGPDRSAEIDRQVLLALRDAPAKDAFLGSVDLELLAATAERLSTRLRDAAGSDTPHRDLAWEFLDLLRRPAVLRRIPAGAEVDPWALRILDLVERSHLTIPTVFRRHAEKYGSKTLFEVPTGYGSRAVTRNKTVRTSIAA